MVVILSLFLCLFHYISPKQTGNSKGSKDCAFVLIFYNKQNIWHIVVSQYNFVEWMDEWIKNKYKDSSIPIKVISDQYIHILNQLNELNILTTSWQLSIKFIFVSIKWFYSTNILAGRYNYCYHHWTNEKIETLRNG